MHRTGAAQASQWWGRTRARQRDYPDMRRRQLFGASGCRNARRIGDESVHHQFVLRAPGDEEYTLCCSRGTGGGRGRLCRISIFCPCFLLDNISPNIIQSYRNKSSVFQKIVVLVKKFYCSLTIITWFYLGKINQYAKINRNPCIK